MDKDYNPNIKGQINETPGNLFDYEKDYALAHWISADCRFDVGLAKFFQARYSTRDAMRQAFPHYEWGGSGICLATNNNRVLNLIVKQHQYEQPLLRNVELALAHMKLIAQERNIQKIALPRIYIPRDAEGFTGFGWQNVKDIIMDMFAGSGFDIRIVYLNEYYDGAVLDPDVERINFESNKDKELSRRYF